MTINRPPRDGNMAFIRSPDNISIELLQKGPALPGGRAVEVDGEHRKVVSRPIRDYPAGAGCLWSGRPPPIRPPHAPIV